MLIVHLTWQYLKLDLQQTIFRYLEFFRSKMYYNELKKNYNELKKQTNKNKKHPEK